MMSTLYVAFALTTFLSKAGQLEGGTGPAVVVHLEQPCGSGNVDEAFELYERMDRYLSANHPDAPVPRLFSTPWQAAPSIHRFLDFYDLGEAFRLKSVLDTEEGWRALLEQSERALPPATRRLLFPIGGADQGDRLFSFRWLRRTRVDPARVELARWHARRIADYLESAYPEIDARALSADLDEPTLIYWMVDCESLESWQGFRLALLEDERYLDLLRAADGLFPGSESEDVMLLDLDVDPSRVDPVTLGARLEARGDRAGVIRAYRQALERDPDDVQALISLGNALRGNSQGEGDPQGGLRFLSRAVALEPTNTAALNGQGLCLWYLGRHAEAAKVFRDALQVDPLDEVAYFNLANVLKAAGSPEALTVMRAFVADRPARASAWQYRSVGWSLRAWGDDQAAERSFRIALELDPDDLGNNRSLLSLLIGEGHHAEARDHALRYLERTAANDPYCGLYCAIAHAALGEVDQARAWYARSLEWAAAAGEPDEELLRLQAEANAAIGDR